MTFSIRSIWPCYRHDLSIVRYELYRRDHRLVRINEKLLSPRLSELYFVFEFHSKRLSRRREREIYMSEGDTSRFSEASDDL